MEGPRPETPRAEARAYMLTYAEALSVAQEMAWTKTVTW